MTVIIHKALFVLGAFGTLLTPAWFSLFPIQSHIEEQCKGIRNLGRLHMLRSLCDVYVYLGTLTLLPHVQGNFKYCRKLLVFSIFVGRLVSPTSQIMVQQWSSGNISMQT